MAYTDIKEIIIINTLHLHGSYNHSFSEDFSNINVAPLYSVLIMWSHGGVGAEETKGNL